MQYNDTAIYKCIILTLLLYYMPDQFLIPESQSPDDSMGVVTLTVRRSRNFVGEVTVYWAVSEDGVMDLEPAVGNVTFAEVSDQRHECC